MVGRGRGVRQESVVCEGSLGQHVRTTTEDYSSNIITMHDNTLNTSQQHLSSEEERRVLTPS